MEYELAFLLHFEVKNVCILAGKYLLGVSIKVFFYFSYFVLYNSYLNQTFLSMTKLRTTTNKSN